MTSFYPTKKSNYIWGELGNFLNKNKNTNESFPEVEIPLLRVESLWGPVTTDNIDILLEQEKRYNYNYYGFSSLVTEEALSCYKPKETNVNLHLHNPSLKKETNKIVSEFLFSSLEQGVENEMSHLHNPNLTLFQYESIKKKHDREWSIKWRNWVMTSFPDNTEATNITSPQKHSPKSQSQKKSSHNNVISKDYVYSKVLTHLHTYTLYTHLLTDSHDPDTATVEPIPFVNLSLESISISIRVEASSSDRIDIDQLPLLFCSSQPK